MATLNEQMMGAHLGAHGGRTRRLAMKGRTGIAVGSAVAMSASLFTMGLALPAGAGNAPAGDAVSVTVPGSSTDRMVGDGDVELTTTILDWDGVSVDPPSGTVTYYENGDVFDSSALVDGSTAVNRYMDGQGGRVIDMVYSGDDTFAASHGYKLVTVLDPTAEALPVSGHLHIQGQTPLDEEDPESLPPPVDADLPNGVFSAVQAPGAAPGDTDITGTLDLEGLVLNLDMSGMGVGMVGVVGAMGQQGPATGTIHDDGTAEMDITLAMQVFTLSGGILGDDPVPIGYDCLVGPMTANMTGALDENGVLQLSADGFNIPSLPESACAGLGGAVTAFLAGDDTALSMSIDMSGPAAPGAISGVVTGNDDLAVAGVNVRLIADDGTVVAGTTTDAAGSYTFVGVDPSGSYVVRAIPRGAQTDSYGITFNGGAPNFASATPFGVTSGDTTTVDIALRKVVTLQGSVTDGGSPVAGATVILRDQFGSSPFIARRTTLMGGTYSFAGLTPGSYTVHAKTPGGAQQWYSGASKPAGATVLNMNNGGIYTANFGFGEVHNI